jgi:hypothetical protein
MLWFSNILYLRVAMILEEFVVIILPHKEVAVFVLHINDIYKQFKNLKGKIESFEQILPAMMDIRKIRPQFEYLSALQPL